MAPAPPMPRKWWDLIEEALLRGWVSNQAAQGLVDAVDAAGERLEKARERATRWPDVQPPSLPFSLPPAVPDDVLLFFYAPWKSCDKPDAWLAARLLAGDAMKAASRTGAGSGSGGAWGALYRKWLEATPEGKEWLVAIKALRRTIERLGLSDRPGVPGHPGNDYVRTQMAAREALLDALQAAYERLGYPPPPEA